MKHSSVPADIIRVRYDETSQEVINRFRWLNPSSFVICDHIGNERIINIDNNYEEVSYNAIPLYDELLRDFFKIDGNQPYKRLYFDSPSISPQDTLKRLQLMYAKYKSDYYLYKKRGSDQLY